VNPDCSDAPCMMQGSKGFVTVRYQFCSGLRLWPFCDSAAGRAQDLRAAAGMAARHAQLT
jgi:hypothetical protein